MTISDNDNRPPPDLVARQASNAADDEYRLAAEEPPDGLAAWDRALREKVAAEQRYEQVFHALELAEEPLRFSVRDVLLLTAFAACLMAPYRIVRPPVYALALGVLAFISLVVLSLFRPTKSILTVGWWVLLAVYLISALAAMVHT